MRLEESLYGGIIQKRKIGNRYICNIGWDLPPIGGGFGSGFGDNNSKKDKDYSYGIKTPIFTPEGTVSADSFGMYTPPKIEPSQDLTIRDFPASNFQLHIHEGAGGITHFKHGKNYSEINSYDAAMADGGKPAYDAMDALEKIKEISMKISLKTNKLKGDDD